MSGESYVNTIKSIDKELKRRREGIKKLNEEKKLNQRYLYQWMKSRGIDQLGGITLKSIEPKEKVIRKKPSEKKSEAIKLFHQIGVPDPQGFWEEFKKTQ